MFGVSVIKYLTFTMLEPGGGKWKENSLRFRLRLVGCKIFSGENIFQKRKYLKVFGGILKNTSKNIF